MDIVRPLAARPEPGYRELIDSYIDRLAHLYDTSRRDLLYYLGLTRQEVDRDSLTFGVGLPAKFATGLSAALRIPERRLHEMTMQSYHLRALRVAPDLSQIAAALWGQSGHIRYCPECLDETNGEWQTGWRLCWEFACLRHSLLLRDSCSACGSLVPPQPALSSVPRKPWTCMASFSTYRRCSEDLRATWRERLPAEHPILQTQAEILALIEGGSSDAEVWGFLQDLRAIAVGLEHFDSNELLGQETQMVSSAFLGLRPPSDRKGASAPTDSLWMAGVSTYALHAMRGGDRGDSTRLLSPIVSHLRGMARETTPSAIFAYLGDTSENLRRELNRDLDPELAWLDRLRFYTCTINPSRPSVTEDEIDQRARWTPAMMWPSWSIRLSAPWDKHPESYRRALASALLLPGAPSRHIVRLRTKLGEAPKKLPWTKYFGAGDYRTRNVLRELCSLADHLDKNGSPIDYARRRLIDYDGLLPQHAWKEMASADGITPRSFLWDAWWAEQYMITRVTGGLGAEPMQPSRASQYHDQLRRRMSLETQQALDAVALDFLLDHGIKGEPVLWEPTLPVSLPEGLSEVISGGSVLDGLWAAMSEGKSIRALAPALGLSESAADLLVDLHRPSRQFLAE